MSASSERLIQLGELTPNVSLQLPLELAVNVPTSARVIGLAGVTVIPDTLEAGTNSVLLTIDGSTLGRGEILLGQLLLSASGTDTRTFWITGMVGVREAPADAKVLTLHARKTQLLPRDGGLMITARVLAALAGRRLPAEDEQYALLGVDAISRMLTIFLPKEPLQPCTLNDQPLPMLSRITLNDGDRVRIGDTQFSVAPVNELPFRLDKAVVRLPRFDGLFPDPTTLEITTQADGFRGELMIVPHWLSARPNGILRLPGNKKHAWEIGFSEEALTLPDGNYNTRGAVILMGSDNLALLDVEAVIARPPLLLNADSMDLGSAETGWPYSDVFTLTITNFGRSRWRGELRPNVGWLEIVSDMPLMGDGWESISCDLKLVADLPGLPVGVYNDEKALLLTATALDDPDGEIGLLYIGVEVIFTAPRGHVELDSDSLHFANIDRFSPELPTAQITVTNRGGGTFQGVASTANGAVLITPDTFTVLPGEALPLQVTPAMMPDQPLDQALLLDTITINEEPGSLDANAVAHPALTIAVLFTLTENLPRLAVRTVTFAPFFVGTVPTPATLMLYNLGPADWNGTLETDLAWLKLPAEVLECEANHRLEIPIALQPESSGNATLPIGLTVFRDAIRIIGGLELLTAAVQVDVRAAAMLNVETTLINFGAFQSTEAELPAEKVRLMNAATEDWYGTVEITPHWMSAENGVQQFALEIAKSSVAEFDVFLTEAARDVRPGDWYAARAVVITTDQAEDEHDARSDEAGEQASPTQNTDTQDNQKNHSVAIPASFVKLNTEAWISVLPEVLQIHEVVADTLRVTNQGTRRGDVQIIPAPWLQIDPDKFQLEPGQSAEVRYVLTGEPLSDPRAVVLLCNGRETTIGS